MADPPAGTPPPAPSPPSGDDPSGDDRSFVYTVDHRVEPEARERFLATIAQLAEAEARRPGFLAHSGPTQVEAGSPAGAAGPAAELWRTRIRWRDLDSWLAWMESPERRRLLEQALARDGFRYEGRTNWRGYARWLARGQAERTPLWKTNLLVLLVLYPTVMALGRLLRDLSLNTPDAALLSCALGVAITGWWLVPLAARLYDGWLVGRWPPRRRALALASILVSLGSMWLLFRGTAAPRPGPGAQSRISTSITTSSGQGPWDGGEGARRGWRRPSSAAAKLPS